MHNIGFTAVTKRCHWNFIDGFRNILGEVNDTIFINHIVEVCTSSTDCIVLLAIVICSKSVCKHAISTLAATICLDIMRFFCNHMAIVVFACARACAITIIYPFISVSCCRNKFLCNKLLTTHWAVLAFCKTCFGTCRCHCWINCFSVTKCINYLLFYKHCITDWTMLTFGKTCFCAGR